MTKGRHDLAFIHLIAIPDLCHRIIFVLSHNTFFKFTANFSFKFYRLVIARAILSYL
jgi:hypothetical protein